MKSRREDEDDEGEDATQVPCGASRLLGLQHVAVADTIAGECCALIGAEQCPGVTQFLKRSCSGDQRDAISGRLTLVES